MTKRHRLTHLLRGHTSDVKAIHATSCLDDTVEVIFSVSRDSTARTWFRQSKTTADWKVGPTFDGGGRYLNAVTFAKGSGDSIGQGSDQVILGGLDGLIRVYHFDAQSMLNSKDEKHCEMYSSPFQIIQEHYNNVTSLRWYASSPRQALLLSASWDSTARSFRRDEKGKWNLLHLLKGHQSAVWGVECVNSRPGEEQYLTASADLFIRLFDGEELKVIWAGHQDVVRSLILLPKASATEERLQASESSTSHAEQLFLSTSNDPPLLINSLSPDRRPPSQPTNGGDPVKILQGHTSIVYDCCLSGPLGGQKVVTSSEDGTVRWWDWTTTSSDNDPLIETVEMPVESVWCVASLPFSCDIVTGGNDGVVRVFSCSSKQEGDTGLDIQDIGRVTEEERKTEELLVQAVANKKGRRGSTQMSEIIALSTDLSEHESTLPASTKRIHPETGLEYDLLLPIDVSDDHPKPLLMGLNRGDDPVQVARAFLLERGLGESERYVTELVSFISMMLDTYPA